MSFQASCCSFLLHTSVFRIYHVTEYRCPMRSVSIAMLESPHFQLCFPSMCKQRRHAELTCIAASRSACQRLSSWLWAGCNSQTSLATGEPGEVVCCRHQQVWPMWACRWLVENIIFTRGQASEIADLSPCAGWVGWQKKWTMLPLSSTRW